MTHSAIIWQGITALVTILTVVAAYLKNRGDRKVDHTETTKKIDAVQATVNGESKATHDRVDQLTEALTEHGVTVPSKPDATG